MKQVQYLKEEISYTVKLNGSSAEYDDEGSEGLLQGYQLNLQLVQPIYKCTRNEFITK